MKGLLLAVLVIAGCESGMDPTGSISSEEVFVAISSGQSPLILDVRSQEEYEQGYIPGAIHIPHEELQDNIAKLGLSSTSEVIVYCHSGGRAAKAEKILRGNGFTNVRDLKGHWLAWSEEKRPITRP